MPEPQMPASFIPDAPAAPSMPASFIPDAPTFSTTNEKDISGAAVVDPNTLGTFSRHLAEQINPVGIGQIIPFPISLGGAGWDAPIKAAQHVLAAQKDVKAQGDAEWAKGNHGTAIRHYIDWLLPIIGPQLDKAANEFQAGKIAAGAGDAVGVSSVLMGPKALTTAATALKGTTAAQALADTADAAASRRIVDVISPKVGANKIRFGNMAEQVAPAVARETTGLTRTAVSDSIASNLENATAKLDAAADARNPNLVYHTKPILTALKAARDRLTAQTVRQGTTTAGADVVPAPNRARVAQIDQAMQEIKQLGPVAKYEPLRRIREAYDGPAKAVYSPAMTADFLTAQGSKFGAADVTSAIRQHLATFDPATAAANSDYSLWKKASDVISAAEETDRARPTVGRTMLARGLGAATGAAEGGAGGAIVGAVIGPLVERVVMNSTPAMKVFAARQFASLADAIRAGNVPQARGIVTTLQKLVPVATANAARAGAALELPKAAQDQGAEMPTP